LDISRIFRYLDKYMGLESNVSVSTSAGAGAGADDPDAADVANIDDE